MSSKDVPQDPHRQVIWQGINVSGGITMASSSTLKRGDYSAVAWWTQCNHQCIFQSERGRQGLVRQSAAVGRLHHYSGAGGAGEGKGSLLESPDNISFSY